MQRVLCAAVGVFALALSACSARPVDPPRDGAVADTVPSPDVSDVGEDASRLDGSVLDASGVDADSRDVVAIDATTIDATAIDAAGVDTGAVDTGAIDSGGGVDVAASDVSIRDTATSDVVTSDVVASDALIRDAVASDVPSSDVPAGDAATPGCGALTIEPSALTYGRVLAIGADGTAYHSYFDAGMSYVSRIRPGAAVEYDWVTLGTGSVSTRSIAVAPDGRVFVLVAVSDVGRVVVIDPRATRPTPTDFGAAFASTSGPGGIAIDSRGRLYVAALDGVYRADAAGARTRIAAGIMGSKLLFRDDTHLVVLSYDGLIELELTAAGAEVRRTAIYPFATRAFQRIGIDILGRWYATVDESFGGRRQERLLRFAPDFTGEESLFMVPASGSSDFGDIAFGKGALRCDIYIAGFSSGRRVPGTTPGAP